MPGLFFAKTRYIGFGATTGIGAVIGAAKTEAPQLRLLSRPAVCRRCARRGSVRSRSGARARDR